MKILELLTCLSWLLLPAFANLRPFTQLPSQSLDHPERIMEERGQLDCLGHNFQDLDILRRFEAPLFHYPEVRVGCETISVKPFRPSSQPNQEDPWAWVLNIENLGKIPPRKANELEDKVVKYFAIDMSGVETQVGPGSAVTVETYDLSRVKVPDSSNEPVFSDLSTRLETFTFDQLCFPSVCYRPGDTKPCLNDMEWFTPEDGGSFLVKCAGLPSYECYSMMGRTAERRLERQSVGSVFSSNITTYCALETNDGLLLGPLRTPKYSGLPNLLSSSSSPRSQVTSTEVFGDLDGQDRTSVLLSSHLMHDEYKGHYFTTGCMIIVPLEAPFNTSFAVDFSVKKSSYAAEKSIRPGQQLEFRVTVKENLTPDGSSFRYNDVVLNVKFEDLCFPTECYQEPPPLDDVKCQITKAECPRFPPAGAVFLYADPKRNVDKLLWPIEGYYNKYTL